MGRGRNSRSYSEAKARIDALRSSLSSGGLNQDQQLQVKLDLSDAEGEFDKFSKKIDDSAKSWAKSFAGMSGLSPLLQGVENTVANVGSMSFPGALAGAAGGLFGSTGSGFVNDVRDTLGGLDANVNASARLGGLGAHFARQGMPLDEKFMRQIAPIIGDEEKEAQKAQRIANDIFGGQTSSEMGGVLYDAYMQMRRMLSLDATKQRR